MEAAVVASMEPLRIDADRIRRRMSEPSLRDDLAAYGFARPEQLLATFVTADDRLADYSGTAPIVTDNCPRIEYFHLYSPKRPIRYADLMPFRRSVETYMIRPPSDPAELRLCEEVIREIWYEYEESRFGRLVAADGHLEHALRLDPENAYLQYLHRGRRTSNPGVR